MARCRTARGADRSIVHHLAVQDLLASFLRAARPDRGLIAWRLQRGSHPTALATAWRISAAVTPQRMPPLGELYDLQEDPGEFDDLWDDPEHAEARRNLVERHLNAVLATSDAGIERTATY